jgi:hypothetical protein
MFALTRKKLGEVYGFRKRVSAVAVLELTGMLDLFNIMVQLASQVRREVFI